MNLTARRGPNLFYSMRYMTICIIYMLGFVLGVISSPTVGSINRISDPFVNIHEYPSGEERKKRKYIF